ncbi:MAG: signal peptidase I [Lachnospiraceae bacterium]|nr:signal peptidase I [Lachnospiraceae bacterium]
MKENVIRRFSKAVFGWFVVILVAVIAGYAFVTFFFQTVNIVGPSMSPTLKDGQVVVVNKIKYKIKDIERYDIVVYKKVESDSYYDVKRVVALPGETVKIENGKVYINGIILSDCPIESSIMNAGIAANDIKLGDNEYFLLGDNVNNSEDSRYNNIGIISKTEITGKVTSIIRPKEEKGKVK